MSLELSWDRVLHGTDHFGAGSIVGVYRELGIKELARLADRDGECEPITSGRYSGRVDAVLLQP